MSQYLFTSSPRKRGSLGVRTCFMGAILTLARRPAPGYDREPVMQFIARRSGLPGLSSSRSSSPGPSSAGTGFRANSQIRLRRNLLIALIRFVKTDRSASACGPIGFDDLMACCSPADNSRKVLVLSGCVVITCEKRSLEAHVPVRSRDACASMHGGWKGGFSVMIYLSFIS